MNRRLRKILTECIRDVETGARDTEGCLAQHPQQAAELRPHLDLWSSLNAAAKAEPDIGSEQRGQDRLLAALWEGERGGRKRMIPFLTPALAKAAAVTAAAALLIGGAAGASAALGGPDVAGEVLSGIGISNASDTGKEHANPNAFDGADNAGQGINNGSETGREGANQNAFEGPGNADEDIDHTPEAEREREMETEQSMERASEGPGEGLDNASEAEREREMETEQSMERASEGPGEAGEGIDNASAAEREQTQEQPQEQAREGASEGPGNGE